MAFLLTAVAIWMLLFVLNVAFYVVIFGVSIILLNLLGVGIALSIPQIIIIATIFLLIKSLVFKKM